MTTAKRNKYILLFILLLSFLLINFRLGSVLAATSDEIKNKIDDLQATIEDLEKQQAIYEKNISLKRKEGATLKSQISIIESNISKTRLEISKKEASIKKTNLEIEEINNEIDDKEVEIDHLKDDIGGLLRKIYQEDNKGYLEIFLLNQRVSDYFDSIKAQVDIQASLQQKLDAVKDAKVNLENKEKRLRDKKSELEDLKKELSYQKSVLEQDRKGKNYLLQQTQGAEWKFQTLLAQAKAEMKQTEKEISYLENDLRKKIAEEEEWKKIQAGILVFSWPVPNNGITSPFHDPDYPFRSWLGEHPAIDIRARQGTSIKASAPGYVGKAKNGGMGYSYILLIHQNGFSTLYGHVSKLYVQAGEYVKRGDIIGLSGGTPGTPGAGPFCTGPHLHFEIRKDGVSVNPMNYLP